MIINLPKHYLTRNKVLEIRVVELSVIPCRFKIPGLSNSSIHKLFNDYTTTNVLEYKLICFFIENAKIIKENVIKTKTWDI